MILTENELGIDTGLRIAGLNVCGLTGKLRLGILEDYILDKDIVCVCETKMHSSYIDNVLHLLHSHRLILKKEKHNERYAGTHGLGLLVSKTFPGDVTVIDDSNTCSHVMWSKVVLYNCVFILGSVYIPNESSIHYDRDWCNDVLSDMLSLSVLGLPFLLLGDFNARTGTLDDFIECDDTVAHACGLDTFSDAYFERRDDLESIRFDVNRHNCDRTVNNNGRKLIELCQVLNLKILNGRCGADREKGEFTCQTGNGRSTVDYALMSSDLLSSLTYFCVDAFDPCLSDAHSPICLEVSVFNGVSRSNSLTSGQCLHSAYPDARASSEELAEGTGLQRCIGYQTKWKSHGMISYQVALRAQCTEFLERQITEIERKAIEKSVTVEDMNQISGSVTQLLIAPAVEIGVTRKTKRHCKNSNKHSRRHDKPWFNEECRMRRTAYLRLKRKLSRMKTEEGSMKLKEEAREYKKFVRKTSRQYFENVHDSLRQLRTSDAREYWKIINQSCDMQDASKEDSCSLDQFYEHFKSMNTPNNEHAPRTTATQHDTVHDISTLDTSILDEPFTAQEVSASSKRLKTGKSSGIDGVANEFLKFCTQPVLALITRWFNVVLETGTVPEDWCLGIISPIYKKKGARNSPENYRGITLLSCIGKLFTSILNKRLSSFIDQERIVGPEQAGFRAGHSTMDHAFALRCIINFYLNDHKRVYAAFLDYRKAFDLVDRPSLWYKLVNAGLQSKLLDVVRSMYAQAKSCVKTKQGLSEDFPSYTGVRQGENLSPLLFSLFIKDFNEYVVARCNALGAIAEKANQMSTTDTLQELMHLAVLLYADDTLLLSETEAGLQAALSTTEEYCSQWKIDINTQKSKVVVFSRGKIRNIPQFTINNSTLDVVFDFSYLGVLFNYRNSFRKAIARQVSQSARALQALTIKSSRLQLPPDVALHLFNHTIIPILTYGCEVWAPDDTDMADAFQRKFIKKLFHLRKSTPNCIVYGETGELPVSCKIDCRLLTSWYKLHFSDTHKLSTASYCLVKQLYDEGAIQCSWLQAVQTKLNRLGFGGLWLAPTGEAAHNPTWFKEAIKLRMRDNFLQSWHEHDLG